MNKQPEDKRQLDCKAAHGPLQAAALTFNKVDIKVSRSSVKERTYLQCHDANDALPLTRVKSDWKSGAKTFSRRMLRRERGSPVGTGITCVAVAFARRRINL